MTKKQLLAALEELRDDWDAYWDQEDLADIKDDVPDDPNKCWERLNKIIESLQSATG